MQIYYFVVCCKKLWGDRPMLQSNTDTADSLLFDSEADFDLWNSIFSSISAFYFGDVL